MSLGEYIGAGASTTKLLLHLNGNSTDSSGNSNNGTDTSITYSQANGKFGQGAGFNGSSSVISLPSMGSMTTCTFSFWIKTTQNTTSSNGMFISYGNYGSGDNADMDIRSKTNKVDVELWNGSSITSLFSISTINDGNWKNIIVTKSGTTVIIYINGTIDNSSSSMSNINITSTSTGSRIGSHADTTQKYSGSIDEVIIENRAWTPEEVAKYFSYSKGRYATL